MEKMWVLNVVLQ